MASEVDPAMEADGYQLGICLVGCTVLLYLLSLKGDPCLENTRGSLGWLQVNLGSFSSLASYGELVDLNADFSAVSSSYLEKGWLMQSASQGLDFFPFTATSVLLGQSGTVMLLALVPEQ